MWRSTWSFEVGQLDSNVLSNGKRLTRPRPQPTALPNSVQGSANADSCEGFALRLISTHFSSSRFPPPTSRLGSRKGNTHSRELPKPSGPSRLAYFAERSRNDFVVAAVRGDVGEVGLKSARRTASTSWPTVCERCRSPGRSTSPAADHPAPFVMEAFASKTARYEKL